MEKSYIKYIVALTIGAILGFISSFIVYLGWFSLIPWGIVGLGLGFYNKKQARILIGMTYGFSLCFTFSIAVYNGASSLITVIPFFTLIGLLGSVCGILLSFIGYFIQVKFTFNPKIYDFKMIASLMFGRNGMLKTKNILIIISSLFLLTVNWLAFHDYQEVHTIRDWLMLFASILVFIQFGKDLWNTRNLKQLK